MAADRIDTTLVAPIVPRTVVTPVRERQAQASGDEISISREARALQALDTASNAEVTSETRTRPELQSYLEAQRSFDEPAGNGRIIEGQYQQKALEDPAGRSADRQAVQAQKTNPQNQSALQAYQDAAESGGQPASGRLDLLA
jgi:hypothetical protein